MTSNCLISFHSSKFIERVSSKRWTTSQKKPAFRFNSLCTVIGGHEFEHKKDAGKCFKLEASNNSMNLWFVTLAFATANHWYSSAQTAIFLSPFTSWILSELVIVLSLDDNFWVLEFVRNDILTARGIFRNFWIQSPKSWLRFPSSSPAKSSKTLVPHS